MSASDDTFINDRSDVPITEVTVAMVDYMNQYRRTQKPARRDTGSTPKRGEVWWASKVDGVKDRPIVILSVNNNQVTYRRCTSQDGTSQMRMLIEDFDVAGLDRATYLDPVPCTMDRSKLIRKLGVLSEYDRKQSHI